MSRKKRKGLIIEQLAITEIAAEGKALGKFNDIVVFVSHVIPGDVVDVEVYRDKRRYMEGKAIKFHEYSTMRQKPVCEHFGTCGGCKWQDLNYEQQLYYKQKQVEDALQRIGKVDTGSMSPILGSEDTLHYRNKLEYTFSDSRWLTIEEINSENDVIDRNALGFHIPQKFDKILDINNCYLQPLLSNEIRLAVKKYAVENNLEFYNIREHTGFLRNIIIRNNLAGDWMVIMAFNTDDKEAREGLLNHIAQKFPAITSLMYVINPKLNDTIYDLEVICYKGDGFLIEELDGLKYKIGPKSFFQTNTRQGLKLYELAKDFAGLNGSEIVYDLYTGTGTIANFIARHVTKVIGIESVPEAIDDARENSILNNIENTVFFTGDMKGMLTEEFVRANGYPEVIITDPPRAGMHPDVVKRILEIEPKRIVYVSCNPATQARDVNLMLEKYTVIKIQPVDMFPHTHHVENIVLLERI
jgi:23S rRNA (uracil1939-C5)-methyltransferase